ncbi:MAG: ATP-dependent zinc metalloprotease FtsH [Clostridiales bacterium]|nr:ATP-dependent zinc metalloprotease FtsH [Clostridiales bacterium]
MPPGILSYLAVAVVVWIVISSIGSMFTKSGSMQEIKYNEFLNKLEAGEVAEVEIQSDRLIITPKTEAEQSPALPESGENAADENTAIIKYYTGYLYDAELINLLNRHQVVYYTPVNNDNPFLAFFMTWILPILVIYGLFTFFINNVSKRFGGKGGFMSFGQSTAKIYVEKKTGVTFDDVAGQEEAKESLMEIVDFLHNPDKYLNIGAKQPKGALLVGPTGTGKTLLAKAVAGEANVAFFSLTGSDFDEMYVGVGASRVRDLFKQANQLAPCIVFIDEVDAIGRTRDGQRPGDNEQTLNQLLSEMDGFDSSKGVVILAATNRPEVLDKALLRPGRFDRRIIVERPDLKGREDILKVVSKKIKISSDVDLKQIALSTSGAAGADLANIVNEAALRAVRFKRGEVEQADLMEAVDIIVAGKEKKDRIMSENEKRIVAFHEVGHALATARQKNTQPVQKITIVPRTTGALGFTMQMPEEERFLMTRDEMLEQITVCLAGRAAEEIVFGLKTTGAANDIEKATLMARNMVELYGMSDKFGMMGLSTIANKYLDARSVSQVSEMTGAEADSEINKIISDCFEKARNILMKDKTALSEIAEFLIQKETITGEEFMGILQKYPV